MENNKSTNDTMRAQVPILDDVVAQNSLPLPVSATSPHSSLIIESLVEQYSSEIMRRLKHELTIILDDLDLEDPD